MSVWPGGCVMVETLNTQGRVPLLIFAIITLWVHVFQQVANTNCSNFQDQSYALGDLSLNNEVAVVK